MVAVGNYCSLHYFTYMSRSHCKGFQWLKWPVLLFKCDYENLAALSIVIPAAKTPQCTLTNDTNSSLGGFYEIHSVQGSWLLQFLPKGPMETVTAMAVTRLFQ